MALALAAVAPAGKQAPAAQRACVDTVGVQLHGIRPGTALFAERRERGKRAAALSALVLAAVPLRLARGVAQERRLPGGAVRGWLARALDAALLGAAPAHLHHRLGARRARARVARRGALVAARQAPSARQATRRDRVPAVVPPVDGRAPAEAGVHAFGRVRAWRRLLVADVAGARARVVPAGERRAARRAAAPGGLGARHIAVAAAERAALAPAVARRIGQLLFALAARPRMAGPRTGVQAAGEPLPTRLGAGDDAAQGALHLWERLFCELRRQVLPELRAAHRERGLLAAEARHRDAGGARRTRPWVACARRAAVPGAAASARPPARVRDRSGAARLGDPSAPAHVPVGHRSPHRLAPRAPPAAGGVPDGGVLVHGVLLFDLRDAAGCPLADAAQVQDRIAPRARPGSVFAGYCVEADEAVEFVVGELEHEAAAQVRRGRCGRHAGVRAVGACAAVVGLRQLCLEALAPPGARPGRMAIGRRWLLASGLLDRLRIRAGRPVGNAGLAAAAPAAAATAPCRLATAAASAASAAATAPRAGSAAAAAS